MKTLHAKKLITIITESILENELLEDFDRLKIRGLTITDARGRGDSGSRDASWDADKNIRIEAVCDESKLSAITETLEEKYYQNYAMVMFISDVQVFRNEKFV